MDQQQPLNDWNLTETSTVNYSDAHTEWGDLYNRTPEAIIVPCVFAAILVTGVVGNTLLILSFVRHKTLSTPHNALVVNLASGDFIFLITSLPFNMVWYTFSSWPFGLAICKLSHFADSLATAVVISTLSFLSIERCLIVTGKKLWRRQKRGPIWLTIAIWSFSLFVSLPNLITTNLRPETVNNDTLVLCIHFDESWIRTLSKIHVGFFFIFLFCLPLTVIATAYILIAVHLISRAFPFSQRKVKTHKTNGKIYLRCLGTKRDKHMSMELTRNNQVNTIKAVNSFHGTQVENVPETSNNHIDPSPQPAKSDTKTGKEDKSYSPDSLTEMTELQQTPVLPYCFVYTGPIPVEAVPKLESSYAKQAADSSENNKKASFDSRTSCPTTATPTVTWKESSPQSPPSSADMKPGYKQRRQTIVTKRRRLAMTVLTLIIVFAICWTPRHVYLLWYHFLPGDYNIFWHVFKIVGFCLASSNSAVNPLVFYILDSTYRSFVHRSLCMVCLKLCRQKKAVDTDVTLGDRDYNATIAMSDVKSKGYVTEL
ncbi:unnamed protein product [Candidula unifasciata]|uniref:G-protein coupled receptors family 1 profile domain-containing protein n=1 Tax=Candidula unifasciata TaxID=100452 RepID=A0A8S3YY50_9EUPU|nr:unnamed protein product [Candidula unifasciata]